MALYGANTDNFFVVNDRQAQGVEHSPHLGAAADRRFVEQDAGRFAAEHRLRHR